MRMSCLNHCPMQVKDRCGTRRKESFRRVFLREFERIILET